MTTEARERLARYRRSEHAWYGNSQYINDLEAEREAIITHCKSHCNSATNPEYHRARRFRPLAVGLEASPAQTRQQGNAVRQHRAGVQCFAEGANPMSKQKLPTCATCIYSDFTLSSKTGKPVRGWAGRCKFVPVLPPMPVSITDCYGFRNEFSKCMIQPNTQGCPCHVAKEDSK